VYRKTQAIELQKEVETRRERRIELEKKRSIGDEVEREQDRNDPENQLRLRRMKRIDRRFRETEVPRKKFDHENFFLVYVSELDHSEVDPRLRLLLTHISIMYIYDSFFVLKLTFISLVFPSFFPMSFTSHIRIQISGHISTIYRDHGNKLFNLLFPSFENTLKHARRFKLLKIQIQNIPPLFENCLSLNDKTRVLNHRISLISL
jgi:hypothetical protein